MRMWNPALSASKRVCSGRNVEPRGATIAARGDRGVERLRCGHARSQELANETTIGVWATGGLTIGIGGVPLCAVASDQ